MENEHTTSSEKASVMLIVIGILVALVVILAVPFLKDEGSKTTSALSSVNTTY